MSTGGLDLARRAQVIRWGGVAWALAFAVAWFPPPLPSWLLASEHAAWAAGFHFFLALAFYDGALSLVEVNHMAVLAELRGGEPVRAKANAAAGVGAAIGALSSFPAHLAWQADCTIIGEAHGQWAWPGPFRLFCVGLALLAGALLVFSAAAFERIAAGQTRGAVGGDALDAGPEALRVVVHDDGGGGDEHAAVVFGETHAQLPPRQPRLVYSKRRATVRGQRGGESRRASVSAASAATPRRSLPPAAPAASAGGSLDDAACAPPPASAPADAQRSQQSSYWVFLSRAAALPAARAYMCIATLQAFDCALGKSFFASFLAVLASPPHAAGGGALPPAPRAPGPSRLEPPPLLAARVSVASFAASPKDGLPWLLSLFPHARTAARASVFSDGLLAGVVAASFLLPHIFTVVSSRGVAERGSATVLRWIFAARLALAAAAAALSALLALAARGAALGDGLAAAADARASLVVYKAAAVVAYQLASRVSSEAVCRALPLAKARLVDAAMAADAERQADGGEGAPLPLAAALGGAVDFFPKIAASVAPLVGFAVVRYGSAGGAAGGDALADAIWVTIIVIPAAVSLSQLAVWGRIGKSL
jgi:hypothetical protein